MDKTEKDEIDLKNSVPEPAATDPETKVKEYYFKRTIFFVSVKLSVVNL